MKKTILLLSAVVLCSCGVGSSPTQSQQPLQGANIAVVTDDKEMGKTYVVPEEAKGTSVSNAQAMTLMRNIVARHEAEDPVNDASDYTYKMRTVNNYGYVIENLSYSKSRKYMHMNTSMLAYPYDNQNRNYPLYSWDDFYGYVKDDQFIKATSSQMDGYVEKYNDGTLSGYVHDSRWNKYYTVGDAENFETDILTELSDFISSIFNIERNLAQEIESYGSMSETYEDMGMGGMMSVETKSKGDGDLYICYSMPMMGMYMEILFEDYWLSYSYMDFDTTSMLAGLGMEDLGAGRQITESHYQINQCEVTYPDLSSYERYGI